MFGIFATFLINLLIILGFVGGTEWPGKLLQCRLKEKQ